MAWTFKFFRNVSVYGFHFSTERVPLVTRPHTLLRENKFGYQQFPTCHYCLQAKDKADLIQQESPELDTLYQKLEVEVRGHDPAVLKSYEWFACEAAKQLGITVAKTFVPPKHIMRRDALKSVHIFKKHIMQYEFRTYFRVIELKHLTGSTADTYLEYIQRNLPEGVAMKVTKQAIEKIPLHIKPPTRKQ